MIWGSDLFPVARDGRADIYGACGGWISWQLTGPGTLTIHEVDNGHATLAIDGVDVGTLNGGCFAGNQQSFDITGSGVHTVRIDRFRDDYAGCQWASWGFDGFTWTGTPLPLATDPGDPDTELRENGATGGDPVSTFTGAFLHRRTDVAIAGRGPVPGFTRSYDSADARVGPLGPGWTTDLDTRLRIPADGTGDIYFVGPDGNTDRFTRNGDGSYSPAAATYHGLVANPDGTYAVSDKARTTQTFDADGRLTAITDRHGNVSTLTYNASGLLLAVTDPAGRGSLTFGYRFGFKEPRIASVTDWADPPRTVSYQYDTAGRLWKVTDREGKTTTFAYDGSTSRLTSISDARGDVALTLTYDAAGRVATQKDALGLVTGATTSFAYLVNGDGSRVTTVTHPPTSYEPAFSPTVVDTHDARGWLTSRVTQPSSTETLTETYTYDATGDRTSVTDARGNRTDFCYDVDPSGAPIAGSRGNLTRRIDPPPTVGQPRPVTLTAYDAFDNVIRAVAPNGVPSGTTVTCATDLSGFDADFATDYVYDPTGARLVAMISRSTDPEAGPRLSTTKYEYGDPANPGLVTRIIPPRGNSGPSPDYGYARTLAYFTTGSRAGMLASLADGLGDTTSYDYDPVGRRTKIVDPLGNAPGGVASEHTTEFVYDKEDRVTFTKLPAPAAGGAQLVTETRFDPVGNPITVVDARGQVTTYAYDVRDALAQVKESPSVWTDPAVPPADVITTEYAYDAAGNLTRMTRAKGNGTYERATDHAYDGRGLVRRETQYPAWPTTSPTLVTTSTYDADGDLATTTDPLGRTTTLGHDALRRLTSVDYSDPATADVSYAYDRDGGRTSMTDGSGTTTYVRDEAGRPVTITSPGPETVGYRYDLDGDRTRLIYPDATALTYTFDPAGRMSGLTDWAARSVAYTYDPDGRVRSATNPDGSVATYTYDNARRLLDIAHTAPGGAPLDRFSYGLDPVGNVTSTASRVTQYARPDGTAGSNGSWTGGSSSIDEIVADDADYLASPSNPTSANYYEATTSDVSPPATTSGVTLRYRYAKNASGGRTIDLSVELRQGTTVIASQTQTNISATWSQANLVLTPAQVSSITNWSDLRIRIRPTTSGSGQSRSARVSWAVTEVPPPTGPVPDATYGYDRLSRLTGATDATASRTYSYDPAGNRLTKTAGSTTTYSYDRADRLTAAGAMPVTVNAVGALTARGSDTFAYDQANRLVTATVAGTTETSTYDGDGVRTSRQVAGGPLVRYVGDVNASLPATIDDRTRKYVWGQGLAYAVAGSTLEVYHADRLGSIRLLTNASGAVTASYRTDEWGIPTAVTCSSSQPFRFTGEPLDASGLTYLRARYYDPTLARFMTRDPVFGRAGDPLSLNRCIYARDNPVSLTDPSGLDPIARVLKTGVACLNAAGQVALEFYAVASAGASAGALLFGGEFVPAVNVALFANTLYNGYVAINNYEFVQQSILYCTGDRDTAPSAPSASGPDLPLPPLPPLPGPAPLPVP